MEWPLRGFDFTLLIVIMLCPYCKTEAVCRDSAYIYYGRSYGFAWLCQNFPVCDTYVGCHCGTKDPLGTMANSKLRGLRKTAHFYFDRLWRSQGMPRGDAYLWLAKNMGISKNACHIGLFDEAFCHKVIELTKERYAMEVTTVKTRNHWIESLLDSLPQEGV